MPRFAVASLVVALVALGCANGGGDASPPAEAGHDEGMVDLGVDASEVLDTGVDAADGGPSADEACTQHAAAFCKRYQDCFPFIVTKIAGDAVTCLDRSKRICLAVIAGAPSMTPQVYVDCAKSFTTLSCLDLAAGKDPPACQAKYGTLANDAPCIFGQQCASLFCMAAPEDACGTCSPPPTEGFACKKGGCGAGLVCVKDVCVGYRSSGSSCDDGHPCIPTLACFGGTCVKSGSLGDKCDPAGVSGPTCDYYEGVWCDGVSAKCKAYLFAPTGGACGTTGADQALCMASGACVKGACVASAADTAACSTTGDGPGCTLFAKCVTSTCRFPDAATCK